MSTMRPDEFGILNPDAATTTTTPLDIALLALDDPSSFMSFDPREAPELPGTSSLGHARMAAMIGGTFDRMRADYQRMLDRLNRPNAE